MTPKQVRRIATRSLGENWRRRFKVKARNRGGRCEVLVIRRPSPDAHGSMRGMRGLVASAPTWDKAAAQVRSGYFREVA